MAVQLPHHHGGLDGEVLPQVVADELLAAGLVHDADKGVAHLAEVLAADVGVVDGDGEVDFLHGGGNGGQVHQNLLIVPLARAGEVVPQVLHRAGGVL